MKVTLTEILLIFFMGTALGAFGCAFTMKMVHFHGFL